MTAHKHYHPTIPEDKKAKSTENRIECHSHLKSRRTTTPEGILRYINWGLAEEDLFPMPHIYSNVAETNSQRTVAHRPSCINPVTFAIISIEFKRGSITVLRRCRDLQRGV